MKLRKLGRRSDHRRMLLRNQVTSLILHDRIETTEAKAKTIKPLVDKMVTLASGATARPQTGAAYLLDPRLCRSCSMRLLPSTRTEWRLHKGDKTGFRGDTHHGGHRVGVTINCR